MKHPSSEGAALVFNFLSWFEYSRILFHHPTMLQFLLLLTCFTYLAVEAALPGQACSATNPCTNSICISGFCSACADDSYCPFGDYCIVQNPPPSAGLKYQTCFPGDNCLRYLCPMVSLRYMVIFDSGTLY